MKVGIHVAGLAALLLGFACSGSPRSVYQPTTLEPAQPQSRDETRPDAFGTYSDEAADRWLTQQVAAAIEAEIRRRDAERRAEQRREEARQAQQWDQQSVEQTMQTYYPYAHHERRPGSYVPWNTMLYGGLGAVIGHQSGHKGGGFAIGAGVGLLHDLLRWRY